MSLKVGIGQAPVIMGDKKANVATLLRYVALGAKARCDVLVLPECSLTGWSSPACRTGAESVPGPFTRKMSALARKYRMAIVVGFEERKGDLLHNSAVLVDRTGRLLLHHRKVNELDIGLALYARGETLAVADFEGRKVGVSICADSWTPEVTDALYALGARLIFSPCAWAIQPGGEECNIAWIGETYRARTKGRDLTIVSANGVGPVTQGPWKGRILQGNSLVTGPGGRRKLLGPANREALLTLAIS